MTRQLRTFVAVAVLTATIWVWADLKQTLKYTVTVPVEVVPPTGFLVRDVAPERLTVKVEGPQGEIQRLQDDPALRVCRITLDEADLAPGAGSVPPGQGFAHWEEMRIKPIEFLDSEGRPVAEVRMELDRFVRLPVDVHPEVSLVTGAVEATAAAMPDEVTARVAASQLASLPEARRYVVARLQLRSMPEDRRVEREVVLEPRLGGSDGVPATFEPDRVTVTATLEATVLARTLPPVPLTVSGPPEMLNTFHVVFQDDTPRLVELKVEGPRESVESLTPQQVRVELVLKPEDAPAEEGTWIPRMPKVIGLPGGVKVVGPLPTINFNLRRRAVEPPGT